MMKRILLLLFLVNSFLAKANVGQNDSIPAGTSQNVLIFKDPRIDYLQKVYSAKFKVKQESKKVFRVQLTSSRSRTEVNDMKSQFSAKYPGIPVFVSFDPPTFKLRVGNFTSKSDAEQFLRELRKTYGSSFIVEQ